MNKICSFSKIVFSLLVLTLSLHSCGKNKDNDILRAHEWKVKELKSGTVDTLVTVVAEYILRFDTNDSYRINLDINICGGNYNVDRNQKINFGGAACTEACCDSQLALDLLNAIMASDKYDFSGEELILSSESDEVRLIKK